MTTTARTALLAVVALLCTLLLAAPAWAADVEVRLTADGPVPADVALPAGGGTVRFVVDDALSHTLLSDGFPEQRLGGLGQPRQVELEFRSGGVIAFTDRRNRPLAPEEEPGSVTVAPAPQAQPSPAGQAQEQQPVPSRTPVAVRTPAARQSGAAPPGVSSPADAVAQPAPSRAQDVVAAPSPGGVPLPAGVTDAPAVAVVYAAAETSTTAPLPPVQAVQGPLPGEPTSRPLGLPAALALLAAFGVASLIVRVLLAEPVARRR